MAEFPPELEGLLDDPPESSLLAILPDAASPPDASEALAQLEQAGVGVTHAAEVAPEHADTPWELEIELSVPGRAEPALARAWLEPAPQGLLSSAVPWRGVAERELAEARLASWAICVSMGFAENPLGDYHAQARLLFALAPEALLVIDVNAHRPRPGAWLREMAETQVPPSPVALFSIHDVVEPSVGLHWLHTHGLDRCGTLELDALDVPAERAGLVGELMNTVASLLLERGLPEPGETFTVGQDIDLVWLPWAEGAGKASKGAPGGPSDRDEAHRGARAILFAPKRGLMGTRYQSLAVYAEALENNPLLYISSAETERMALLASERLPRFFQLFDRWGGRDDWRFLVKLGYLVDGAEDDSDREHLWFDVHGLLPGEVDATLLNAPYRIARLHEGDRGRHPLDRLTDWAILCDAGRFDAGSVTELERLLSQRSLLH